MCCFTDLPSSKYNDFKTTAHLLLYGPLHLPLEGFATSLAAVGQILLLLTISHESLHFSNHPTYVLAICFSTLIYHNTTMTDLQDPHHKTNGINSQLSNGHTIPPPSSPNAWSTPGSAAFDFRSTTPRIPVLRTSIHQLTPPRRHRHHPHRLYAGRHPTLHPP